MELMRRLLVVLAVLSAVPAFAQNYPNPIAESTTLTSATCPGTGCLTMGVTAYGTVGIQLTGTWSGTISFLGSIDQVNFSAINCTPPNGSSAVTTTTGNGTWTCAVAGLDQVQVDFGTYVSGSAVVTIQAAVGGGSAGGGGSSSSVTIQDPTTSSQKAAVNSSGQLSIVCANCSGSGASAGDNSAFTAGTTSGAPAMGFYHSTIDSVTDGHTAAIAIDPKRNLFTVIRDAADNARGVNVTSGNALTVDGSATTQPVSGTFWQTTQPVSGTFWQTTQPVSAASLPLPSGASTAAKQPALGTAGTASSDVISVQGIASMTALKVDGSGVTQPVSGTVTANAGTNLNTSALATSANQTNASQKTQIVDGSGNVIASTSNNLNVQCANCSGSGASAADNATVTEGTSTFAPVGGEFQTTPGTVTAGHQSMAAITAHRAIQISPFDTAGASLVNADGGVNSHITNSSPSATADTISGVPYVQQTAAHSQTVSLQTASTANGNGNTLATLGEAMASLTVNCASCSGGTLINFEGSEDNTNYTPLFAWQTGTNTIATTTSTSGLTYWTVAVASAQVIRARISAYSAGTVTVTGHSVPVGVAPPTTNANIIGTVPVSGTFWQTTQPVSGTVTANVGTGSAFGATGSAVPANAVYTGANPSSGNLTGDTMCDKAVLYDASTSGSTQLVAISASTHVYVCGFTLFSAGTVNVSLTAGTGTACASAASGANNVGTTGAAAKLTPAYQLIAQTGLKEPAPTHGYLFDAGSANALCLNTSGAVAVQAEVWYAQR